MQKRPGRGVFLLVFHEFTAGRSEIAARQVLFQFVLVVAAVFDQFGGVQRRAEI